jgi:3-oxoacyl-[acyl-carrier-protein] synthase III
MVDAIADGTITRGDLVLLLAFGGGLTWGATLLRY